MRLGLLTLQSAQRAVPAICNGMSVRMSVRRSTFAVAAYRLSIDSGRRPSCSCG